MGHTASTLDRTLAESEEPQVIGMLDSDGSAAIPQRVISPPTLSHLPRVEPGAMHLTAKAADVLQALHDNGKSSTRQSSHNAAVQAAASPVREETIVCFDIRNDASNAKSWEAAVALCESHSRSSQSEHSPVMSRLLQEEPSNSAASSSRLPSVHEMCLEAPRTPQRTVDTIPRSSASRSSRRKLAAVLLDTPRDFPRHLYIDLTDRPSVPSPEMPVPRGPARHGIRYSDIPGPPCHQCKRRSFRLKMPCSRADCTRVYCSSCIKRYAGIIFDAEALDFDCPRCLGNCNCPRCRAKRGSVAGGNLTSCEEVSDEVESSIACASTSAPSPPSGSNTCSQPVVAPFPSLKIKIRMPRPRLEDSQSSERPLKKFRRRNAPPGATDMRIRRREKAADLAMETDESGSECDRPEPPDLPFQALAPSVEESSGGTADMMLTLPVMAPTQAESWAETSLLPLSDAPAPETPFSSAINLLPEYPWQPPPLIPSQHIPIMFDARTNDWLDMSIAY